MAPTQVTLSIEAILGWLILALAALAAWIVRVERGKANRKELAGHMEENERTAKRLFEKIDKIQDGQAEILKVLYRHMGAVHGDQ